MQAVFEKIIEKLEERTSFLSDCTKYGNKDAKQQGKSYSTMMMYEVADLVDDLIDIVKQEAEQYEECYKHCGECEAYDKEKHHCPKFCKVIKETVKEIEENHNGWIPVRYHYITDEEREEGCISEDIAYWLDCKLPEDGEEILITRKWRDGYIVEHDMCMVDDGYCLDSGLDWTDVIAWQPLPQPYKPKGE